MTDGPPPMRHADVNAETNRVTGIIVDALHEVHRHLGPGLLESLYEEALVHELQARGLFVRRQVPIVASYKGTLLSAGFRIDLLVEDRVIVEVKALEAVPPVAYAQLRTYLHLSGMQVGFLVNFNAPVLKGNFERLVRTPPAPPAPPPLRASAVAPSDRTQTG